LWGDFVKSEILDGKEACFFERRKNEFYEIGVMLSVIGGPSSLSVKPGFC
jgi:hypothetical protein